MNKVEEIVKECIKRGISVTSVDLAQNGNMAYSIEGFSKSGTAQIYQDGNIVICETRYNTVDYIEDFAGLASVAFEWNSNYCNREPFGWDSQWVPVFEEYGWIKIKTKTVAEVTVL